MNRNKQIQDYLQKLSETKFHVILMDFFTHKVKGVAVLLHGPTEHGIDIAVKVPEDRDHIMSVFYLIVQAKCGNLTSTTWRNDVLGQLLEASYHPIQHPKFPEDAPRRILLMITGTLNPEVRQAVVEYNKRHYLKLEVFELTDLANLFERYDYYEFLEPSSPLESSTIPVLEVYGEAGKTIVDVPEYGSAA